VGAGYAFGKGLYAPGFRLRAVGAFGNYNLDSSYKSALGDAGPTNLADTFLRDNK
jgi:hypothetical protein